MCLAIPGRVTALFDADGVPMGKVDFGGAVRDVCLAYLPDIAVGAFVLVHAGFAISQIDETAAQDALRTFAELDPPAEATP